jgi:geranylgeranyl diphosphate synthase type I
MGRDEVDLEAYLARVREEMHVVLSPDGGEPDQFYAAMRYAVGLADEALRPADAGGGKLLRPRLCLLACVAAGGEPAEAVPAAAALELLHNFTLVHDDIQDGSPTRRHRPSVWSLLGVPLAINTGDAMHATSHLVLGGLADEGLDAAVVLRALEEFSRTARRLCEGQHMDISYESRTSVSSGDYLAMIGRKTGALMGLSCYLGALVAGVEPDALEGYRRFGELIGIGYQVRDDLAGVWHEEASTGKRLMEDVYSRKKSYPAVRAFETATGPDAERLRAIYADGRVSTADAHWVRDLMTRLGLHEEGRERVRECVAAGIAALDSSGASGPAAGQLRAFADDLLQ